MYEMATHEHAEMLREHQKKTARGVSRKQVKYTGQITTDIVCQQEWANEEAEAEKQARREARKQAKEIKEDNLKLVAKWTEEEKVRKAEEKVVADAYAATEKIRVAAEKLALRELNAQIQEDNTYMYQEFLEQQKELKATILANEKAAKLVALAEKKAEKEKERCEIDARAPIGTVKRPANSPLKKPPRRRFMYQ
jgi:hypothetical protein